LTDVSVRPMLAADLDAVEILSAAAFDHDISGRAAASRWHDRIAYPLGVDPQGAFVAERAGRVIGAGQAMRRERLWLLSLLTVDPNVQSAGVGRALMDRTLAYGDGTDAGLIVSSNDPRAMRLYARAGFAMLPALRSDGKPDRSKLPAADRRVRDGGAEDLERLAAISREIRGAPHTPEIAFLLARDGAARLLLIEDRGFAVVLAGSAVWLLAARDEDSARALLWAAIEAVGDSDRGYVSWITGDQQWAVDVVVAAGLRLTTYGALCVRGNPGRLAPFLPSGAFI
jgi:predicted N-acetyltransferase YhbS